MKGIAQRDAPALRIVPLRFATAILILVAGLAGTAILHGIRVAVNICQPQDCNAYLKPSWADPAALALCVLAAAAAAYVLVIARRNDPSRPKNRRGPLVGVVLLLTSLLCLWLLNYRDWIFLMRRPHIVMWPNPAWTLPTAFTVGVLGAIFALVIYYRPQERR